MIKMSEKAVNEHLAEKLIPGEMIVCSVYCTYKPLGFFASAGNAFPAAAAITNIGRFFVVGSYLTDATGFFWLRTAKKLKVGKNLFGQNTVDFEFEAGKETYRFRLQIAPKVYGCNFPNQQKHLDRMLSAFRQYAVG